MREIEHLIDKSIAEANAFYTGRILGKLEIDPSKVTVDELERIHLEYVELPDEKY